MFVSNMVSKKRVNLSSGWCADLFWADIIICEDDPYYFLQYPEYEENAPNTEPKGEFDSQRFLESLAPSFLKYDYQGRVIRLESFSKVDRILSILY